MISDISLSGSATPTFYSTFWLSTTELWDESGCQGPGDVWAVPTPLVTWPTLYQQTPDFRFLPFSGDAGQPPSTVVWNPQAIPQHIGPFPVSASAPKVARALKSQHTSQQSTRDEEKILITAPKKVSFRKRNKGKFNSEFLIRICASEQSAANTLKALKEKTAICNSVKMPFQNKGETNAFSDT